LGVCAIAAVVTLASGAGKTPAQASPNGLSSQGPGADFGETRPFEDGSTGLTGDRLAATLGSREPGAMQVVFVDGASLRLNPANLAQLDEFARAADGIGDGAAPALAKGIVRLENGRLRSLPVLLSGTSATANASLAVHAAMRGDSAAALSALSRAKAASGDGTVEGEGGWASVTRAHVMLAEAQILDLDDRHGEAETLYLGALEAIDSDGEAAAKASAAGGAYALGDVQVLLAAELTQGLAGNLAAQGRHGEAQAAARHSVRTYVQRFGRAPAFAGSGLNGGARGGFTQVAVNRLPGGAIVSQMLMSGALFVTVLTNEASGDSVRDPSGEAGGTERSTDALGDDEAIREPSGEPGGTPRSGNGAGDGGGTRDASGEAGGRSRSTDGSGAGNTRDASGEAGGRSRSTDGSGAGNTRDASGEAGGRSRSTDGSGGDNSRDASGEAGGRSRS